MSVVAPLGDNGPRLKPDDDGMTLASASLIVKRRSRGACESPQHQPGCSRRGEHIHHRRPRSLGGTHDPSNLLHLSHVCHLWAHNNVDDAAEFGLIIIHPRKDTPT